MELPQPSPQTKTFFLGISISILILVSFFAGGLADRVFVIKPLDYFVGKRSLSFNSLDTSESAGSGKSLLGSLMTGGTVDVADVAEAASKSVVTVSVKQQQRVINPFSGSIFANPFNIPPAEGDQTEIVKHDIGSGFVVEGGLIVTNRHVVNDALAEYSIIDRDDKEYKVINIYRDPTVDLAILKVEDLSLPGMPLGDSDNIRVGQGVIVIGTALGEFRHTVTTGVVSGLGRGVRATDGVALESLDGVILTDAAINPGNSGGPLLNSSGQVIGVSAAVSSSGQNIGFAIPINVVRSSIDNFNQTGQFERPFLGVRFRMITEKAALLNEVPQGALVAEVVKGSTADEAGIKVGDIITEFDGVSFKGNTENLASYINKKKIGDRVTIKFWRDKVEQSVEMVLKGQSLESSPVQN